MLSTLLPDHALNAFRTLFPLGKVRVPCCAWPCLSTTLTCRVGGRLSRFQPLALSACAQFGAEFNAWVTAWGACGMLASRKTLDESPAALALVPHRLHYDCKARTLHHTVTRSTCAGFAWLVGPMEVEEVDVMFQVRILHDTFLQRCGLAGLTVRKVGASWCLP